MRRGEGSGSAHGRDRPRTVVFVAPEFPPCNLTAGHRTRLFVRHLPEFGYTPVVLTVRPEDYETRLDPDLLGLVAPGVEVVRTRALPVRPVRVVGDLGIRSLPFHLAALARLRAERRIDLVYLPIPPNYSALLGPAVRTLFGLPYAIDYIDPWVYPILPTERKSWKARTSHRLARWLEPVALSRAAGVTGVAEAYFAGVFARHPQLRRRPSAGIPYGGEPADHAYAAARPGPARLLDRPDLRGRIVLVYAGALLPRAVGTLRTLLTACRQWVESGDPTAARVSLLFLGTGLRPTDPGSGTIVPIARECGADRFVVEVADRQPFVDVLQALHQAHGVMVLGSSERHYTASKTFQALMSGRPVLAMLHADSTAVEFVRGKPGIETVTYTDAEPVETRQEATAAALAAVAAHGPDPVARPAAELEPYSAREMTHRLAAFFDAVLARPR